MIKNIDINKISKNDNLNRLFLSASLKEINQQCKIFEGDFFLDSFNYFPITLNYETFFDLYKIQNDNPLNHFYTKDFYNNIKEREKNFKVFENTFILGSSTSDNYYTNLITFLPRIFFAKEKKINLIIHRNLSNKFRNLIESICMMRDIDLVFNYVDDEFYKFKNSKIPQFIDIERAIIILKFFFEKILLNTKNHNFGSKIYIRRESGNYRKILNESDLITRLRENGFEIINPQHFEIIEQMKIFSDAKLIISPQGSNLSNIIFCKKHTRVIEIGPKLDKPYEINLANRYKYLSSLNNLHYKKILSDTVDVKEHSALAKKYITSKVLNESNYYKNIILKISEIDEMISSLRNDNLV